MQTKLYNDIKKIERELNDLIHQKETQLRSLKSKCKHENVVTLNSYYGGSYSWDFDDWEPEVRYCIICGLRENGGTNSNFDILLNPFCRFEFPRREPGTTSGTYTHQRWKEYQEFIKMKPKDAIEYCKKNGYSVIRYA